MRGFRISALGSFGAVAVAATLASGASAATPATVQLRNSQSPAASRTPRVGSVAGDTQMNFEVDLKLPDQAGAQAFAQSVSTPEAPATAPT